MSTQGRAISAIAESCASDLAAPGSTSAGAAGDAIPRVGVSLAGLERFAAELAAATRGLPGGYVPAAPGALPRRPPHEHALIAERATNVCCDICDFDPIKIVTAARRRVRAAQRQRVEARGGSRLRVQASRRRLYLAQGRLSAALRRRLWHSCGACGYDECVSCFAETERLALLPPELTTDAANKMAMAHLTGARRCAFSDLLGGDPALVGEATVFVSHSWAAPLDALVACVREADAALRRPSHPRHAPGATPYFWVDLVVNDQFAAPSRPFAWWQTVFRESVERIGHTVVALEWENPRPRAASGACGRCSAQRRARRREGAAEAVAAEAQQLRRGHRRCSSCPCRQPRPPPSAATSSQALTLRASSAASTCATRTPSMAAAAGASRAAALPSRRAGPARTTRRRSSALSRPRPMASTA